MNLNYCKKGGFFIDISNVSRYRFSNMQEQTKSFDFLFVIFFW